MSWLHWLKKVSHDSPSFFFSDQYSRGGIECGEEHVLSVQHNISSVYEFFSSTWHDRDRKSDELTHRKIRTLHWITCMESELKEDVVGPTCSHSPTLLRVGYSPFLELFFFNCVNVISSYGPWVFFIIQIFWFVFFFIYIPIIFYPNASIYSF